MRSVLASRSGAVTATSPVSTAWRIAAQRIGSDDSSNPTRWSWPLGSIQSIT